VESDGTNEYTITDSDKKERGTEITLYLRDTEDEFLEPWKVKSLIKKYSDFIAFPIYLPDDKGKEEVVNVTKPLWKRSPSEVTEEQYADFFKQRLEASITFLYNTHQSEGVTEFSSLVFYSGKVTLRPL